MLNLMLHPRRQFKHFSPSAFLCIHLGCVNDANLDMNINKLLHINSAGDFFIASSDTLGLTLYHLQIDPN